VKYCSNIIEFGKQFHKHVYLDILDISVLSQVTILKIRKHFNWTRYERHSKLCRAIFTLL